MMKLWLIPVVVLGSVLLATPAAAGNGDTGACWRLDEVDAGCVPAVTEQQCNDIYFWTEPAWNAGSDCTDLDVPFAWDGSCLGTIPVVGERCMLFWATTGGDFTSVEHCEEEEGTWFDNLTCDGVPVPAMPRPALALMAFVILGASLVALASRGA